MVAVNNNKILKLLLMKLLQFTKDIRHAKIEKIKIELLQAE